MGPEQTMFVMNLDATVPAVVSLRAAQLHNRLWKVQKNATDTCLNGHFGMRKVLSGKRGRLAGQRCEGCF